MSKIDYKKAGVDIDAGNEAVENIKEDIIKSNFEAMNHIESQANMTYVIVNVFIHIYI